MRNADRGISYECHLPTLEVTEAEICNKNRGRSSSDRYVRHIPMPPPVPSVMERRMALHAAQPAPTQASELFSNPPTFLCRQGRGDIYINAKPKALSEQAVTQITDKKWASIKNSEKVLDEVIITHQANIRRSLEHRLRVAQVKGDRYLLRQLEAELEEMTFSA